MQSPPLPKLFVSGENVMGTFSESPHYVREDEKIINALRQTNGNKSKAAKLLCVARSTLYRQMQRYNIKDSNSDSSWFFWYKSFVLYLWDIFCANRCTECFSLHIKKNHPSGQSIFRPRLRYRALALHSCHTPENLSFSTIPPCGLLDCIDLGNNRPKRVAAGHIWDD